MRLLKKTSYVLLLAASTAFAQDRNFAGAEIFSKTQYGPGRI